MNKKYLIALFAVVIFLIVGFFLVKNTKKYLTPSLLSLTRKGVGERSEDIKYVEIGGKKLKVDLALTAQEQTQGLSGRQSLLPDTGMLFVFDTPGKYPFWMKDMNFPIDMIWITADMKVDYVAENATPQSYLKPYPTNTFAPGDNNAVYVLETTSGFSNTTHLKIGDSVTFIY